VYWGGVLGRKEMIAPMRSQTQQKKVLSILGEEVDFDD
jgi:hypothetical protein